MTSGKAGDMLEGKPLFATEEEALKAEGELYHHYKGGIYRLVQKGIIYCENLEPHVLYEHLYPHAHRFWLRSEKDFFATLPSGEPRFKKI